MGNFAKPLCCTKQSIHQLLLPIVLCKIVCVASEWPCREAEKATEVLGNVEIEKLSLSYPLISLSNVNQLPACPGHFRFCSLQPWSGDHSVALDRFPSPTVCQVFGLTPSSSIVERYRFVSSMSETVWSSQRVVNP